MDILEGLTGSSAIGHVRYSTTGSSVVANAQPFVVRHRNRAYAVAHNGNLVNAHHVKAELEDAGSIFQTTMDSEVFLHLFVRNLKLGFRKSPESFGGRLKGAFSMVVLTSRGR
jgi:amidophosphoribosyltransferase